MAIHLILALNVLVFIAISAARVMFSLYGLHLGAGAAGVGAILASLYLFPLLLSWPIGVLADRVGGRWLLIGGVTSGVCGMLLPYFRPALASLYVAALLLGLTIALVSVIGQNLVGVLSPPEQRTRNFNNYSLTGSISILFGPLLCGFAIDHVGHVRTSLAIALMLLLGVILLAVLGKALPRGTRQTKPGGNLLGALRNPLVRKMLVVSSMAQLGNDLFQVFLPIYAHGIGLSASIIGGLLAALAVGSILVRLVMLPLIARIGERRLLAIAFYVGAVVFLLIPLLRDAGLLALFAFVFGLCLGCTQTLMLLLMYSSAEEGRAGETVGLRLTVNNISRIFGPALFGLIGTLAGLLAVFWINGFLMASMGRWCAAGKDRPPARR